MAKLPTTPKPRVVTEAQAALAAANYSTRNFSNMSIGDLANEFGEQKAREKAAKEEAEVIKAELQRRGVTDDVPAIGSRFTVEITTSTPTRFDTKLAKAALGPKKTALCEVVGAPQTTARVKPTQILGQVAA